MTCTELVEKSKRQNSHALDLSGSVTFIHIWTAATTTGYDALDKAEWEINKMRREFDYAILKIKESEGADGAEI